MCDGADNCPADPNPDQADGDGDGRGDVCDPCTGQGTIGKPKLTIGGLSTPSGDDRLKVRGEITPPFPFSPALDPAASGVRILITDATGATVLDGVIPGGPYDYATQTGWKSNSSRTRWSYRNGLGGIGGIVKVALKIGSSPWLLQFSASGRNGTYAVAPTGLPVHVTFAVDASAGQCGEVSFAGPPPSPSCAFSSSGRTLGCK